MPLNAPVAPGVLWRGVCSVEWVQGTLKAASEEEAKSLQAVLQALEDASQCSEALLQAKAALESHQRQHSAELQRLEAAVGVSLPLNLAWRLSSACEGGPGPCFSAVLALFDP